MNVVLSIVKYIQEKQNLMYSRAKFECPSNWKDYKFLTYDGVPIVCFSDPLMRVGNFFYAYPNKNMQMTFFASAGCLNGEVEEVSKLKWLILFLKKVS